MRDQTAFFKRRTAREPIIQLLGYSEEVRGKKDRFQTYDVYAGRIYSDGTTPEIASIGIEHLWRDPIKAAEKNSEWFELIIRNIKWLEE